VNIDIQFMPTAPPPTRDVALETRVFWLRFRKEIVAVIIVAFLAIVGYAAFQYYSDRREEAASLSLAGAKGIPDFEQVIARYSDTPAGASAYLLLADKQRAEKKFAEANGTLQNFVNKNPEHELAATAKMAMAANLESMGKTDEALAMYQQVVSSYPTSFDAPLALISRVHLLKAKNRNDEARQACEMILTQYRESTWSREAAQELHFLKPSSPATSPGSALGGGQKGMPGAAPSLLLRPPAAAPSVASTPKPK
jgi:TolA-binding protein